MCRVRRHEPLVCINEIAESLVLELQGADFAGQFVAGLLQLGALLLRVRHQLVSDSRG